MRDTPDLESLVKESEEALALLASVAGGRIRVHNESDEVICDFKEGAENSLPEVPFPFRIEAEPVGTIRVNAVRGEDVARLAAAVLLGAYRRKLVVDVYRETLSESYEELLQRNQQLSELAASLEERVQAQTRELDEAHARLAREEKVAAIGRLAAGVAHELNTPLSCVRSNLSVLREIGPSSEEVGEILCECIEMTDRAAGIVRDMRGFSHVDDMGTTEIQLNDEIDRILARLDLPVGLTVERDYGSLPPVCADGRHLTVALLHVLENARDAVAQEHGRIRVLTRLEADHAVVLVSDNGPGIPPEIAGKVFDPFFTTKDVGAGTGLGLTVARDIMRAHGGDLVLECPPGGGTVAHMSIRVSGTEGAS